MIDTDTLDLLSARRCVLGQLESRGVLSESVEVLMSTYGFVAPRGVSYPALTAEWREAIQTKRAAE
jgi:hypothetical protein